MGGRPGEEIVELTKAGWRAAVCAGLRPDRAGLQHRLGDRAQAPAADLAAGLAAGERKGAQRAGGSSCRPSRRPPACPGSTRPSGAADKVEKLDILAVFATAATVASRVYEIEIDKRRQDVAVFSQACPELVPMIEAGAEAGRWRRSSPAMCRRDPADRAAPRPGDPRLHPL